MTIPAIAYAATGYLDDDQGRHQFHRSFLATLGVTCGLKRLVDKRRPNGDGLSFPSSHTSVAFQGAAFIHRRYGLRTALPAYAGAAFVGYSRVEADKHYVEDVLAGAALGILSAHFQVEPRGGVVITPMLGDDAIGLALHARW